MDNVNLDQLLKDRRKRQFWLKPIGIPGRLLERPGVALDRLEEWPQSEIEIRGKQGAEEIEDHDICIAFRTGFSKLIYVAERLPKAHWTTPEDPYSKQVRTRYPYFFKTKNLTPRYGDAWDRFDLRPFRLVREYNALNSKAKKISLGALQFGQDRLHIPRPFAEFLIRKIREL